MGPAVIWPATTTATLEEDSLQFASAALSISCLSRFIRPRDRPISLSSLPPSLPFAVAFYDDVDGHTTVAAAHA